MSGVEESNKECPLVAELAQLRRQPELHTAGVEVPATIEDALPYFVADPRSAHWMPI